MKIKLLPGGSYVRWRWYHNGERLHQTIRLTLKLNSFRALKPLWHVFGPDQLLKGTK